MKLNLEALKNRQDFEKAGVSLPYFNIEKMKDETSTKPSWIHFGGGNIFRVFVASALQKAIELGKTDTGVIVAESYDFEIIDKFYDAFDCLSLSVIMNADGSFDKSVIASIADAIKCAPESVGFSHLKEVAANASLKMISYTITEKGYALKNFDGEFFPFVQTDIDNGPSKPTHAMSILTALLLERFNAGKLKLAVVSMDNCSHNGDKIACAVKDIANAWQEKGFVSSDFVDYVMDEAYISFPFTMIDKITPRPAEVVQEMLENSGLENMGVIVTDKGSYTAPFVNAEACEYLIIEDKFPNGKIDISNEKVIFTDRNTVNNVEIMKVTTCLNPIHTALAVTGCLLGHTLIADEMKDSTLLKLANQIGYAEGMKVVLDPKIISPKRFIDEVINERLTNPYIPDTPQRIATDTSQKVGIRFGETIKSYQASKDLEPKDLIGIPLALAAWCRYLVGIDDNGDDFEISNDPMKDELLKIFGDKKIGDTVDLTTLLSNSDIFGIDLFDVNLGDKVQGYFNEMLSKIGGVRETINKYL